MKEGFISLETSFKKDFGHLTKVKFNGAGSLYKEIVVSITRPFIFDGRQLPRYYMGLRIDTEIPINEIPKALRKKEGWSDTRLYKKYEKYVDRDIDKIRLEMDNPNMTREEVLDALCPGNDFKDWVSRCKEEARFVDYY